MRYQDLRWEVLPNPLRPEELTIGRITLNRPEILNAINVRTRIELGHLFDEIRHNGNLRVIIITGEGRCFSSGGDLQSEAGPLGVNGDDFDFGSFGPYRELANLFFNDLRHKALQETFRKLEDLPQITIAAINGPAVGLGLELCTLCDIRWAGETARLGEVAVKAGFVPESGGARNLPRLVGIGRAMEMILTGRLVPADEAERIGLIDKVVREPAVLADSVLNLAGEIAAKPFVSVRKAKELVRYYWNKSRDAEGWEREFEAIREVTRTADCREGIDAFLTKRTPVYDGPWYEHSPFK